MKKAKKHKDLKIDKLALVRRGANRVNFSVLKSDKNLDAKIFKEESTDEAKAKADFEEFIDYRIASEVLLDIAEVAKECPDENTRNKLTEILESYEKELPTHKDGKAEPDSDATPTVTADELLKQMKG